MSVRRMTCVLGTAAGAFLAAGLIPLASSPAAHAVCVDDKVGCDPDFISATDSLLKLFGVTDIGAADPGDNFEGTILNIPALGVTDVLTSGNDPSDLLADLGVKLPDDTGIGEAGVTVNTLIDPSLGIDSSFTIPFTDPLASLWDVLVGNSFFGL
jgi:hypothetical protein